MISANVWCSTRKDYVTISGEFSDATGAGHGRARGIGSFASETDHGRATDEFVRRTGWGIGTLDSQYGGQDERRMVRESTERDKARELINIFPL